MNGKTKNQGAVIHSSGSKLQKVDEGTNGDFQQGWILTPERKKEILKARALELSKEHKIMESAGKSIQIVEFLLGYERYGIELTYLKEVYPLKEITPLPGVPHFVLGLINVRGQILSVIDIKKFFDLPEKGLTDLNRVLIVDDSQMGFSILADGILDIRSIQIEEIQPSLPTLKGIRDEYLKGVTGDRVVILDMKKLIHDKNIIVHEEVEL
jgi:purine-binding chemotaxis protein CheW